MISRRRVVRLGPLLLLFMVTIVGAYVLVAPPRLRAKTLAAGPGGPVAAAGGSATSTAPIPGSGAPAGDTPVTPPVPLAPATIARVTGRVVDADHRPLADASIVVDGHEVRTDPEGVFAVESVPAGARLVAKLPGYRRVTVKVGAEPIEIVLSPHVVKAAYLTYFGVSDRGIRTRVLDLAERTELNAVVIDVKGDRGWIPYRSVVPLAREIAQGPVIMKDFDALMADLKARGIYTIARIVTFKDNVLATAHPEWAVIDTRTARPWIDNEKLAWADPFHEQVWKYNLAIAREAVGKGFDEIQFDYVRFPTDGRLATARYSKPNTRDSRLPAIAGFLGQARSELGPLGVFVAADIFGYTAFNENDTQIGQRIEELAPHLDYLCPMVYPSGYHRGIPGYRNPIAHPYAVVHESVKNIRRRTGLNPVRVRPWLQDFKDYAFDRRIFGVQAIRAQMKGAAEAGAIGWMLWNPKNDYTGAALRPKGSIAAR